MAELTDRELDAKVQEVVFGNKTSIRACYYWNDDHSWSEVESNAKLHEMMKADCEPDICYQENDEWKDWVVVPFYSTDMRNAWKLVDKFAGKYEFSLSYSPLVWTCYIRLGSITGISVVAETPEIAICRAAIMVTEHLASLA